MMVFANTLSAADMSAAKLDPIYDLIADHKETYRAYSQSVVDYGACQDAVDADDEAAEAGGVVYPEGRARRRAELVAVEEAGLPIVAADDLAWKKLWETAPTTAEGVYAKRSYVLQNAREEGSEFVMAERLATHFANLLAASLPCSGERPAPLATEPSDAELAAARARVNAGALAGTSSGALH